MPIYAYRCETCGFAKDVLQKMSDPLLIDCPSCGSPTFRKQVTAAGFQLKGSGWYVTDFRNGQKEPPKPKTDGATTDGGDAKPTADGPKSEPAAAASSTAAPAAAPAPAPAPAGKASPPPAGGTD